MQFPFIPCTLKLDRTGWLQFELVKLDRTGWLQFELVSANQARCLSAITMLMEIPIMSQELIIDV